MGCKWLHLTSFDLPSFETSRDELLYVSKCVSCSSRYQLLLIILLSDTHAITELHASLLWDVF